MAILASSPTNLITAPDRAPVVVEAEYEAVGTGESDAKSRLGLPVVNQIHSIEAAIALRYPDTVRFGEDLRDSLNSARLTYAVFYDDEDQTRFPESGWLDGSVTDLADLISPRIRSPESRQRRRRCSARRHRQGRNSPRSDGGKPAQHVR